MEQGFPRIHSNPAAACAVDRLQVPARYVTIHTESEEQSRNWDLAKWEQLVEHLVRNHKIAVVEIGQRTSLRVAAGRAYIDLCGKCGLVESAEVIRRSSLFIGIDSGPAHLANAVQTRGVILLGAYRAFRRYMPYTGFYADPVNCQIIQYEATAAEIPLELCLAAVDEALRQASATAPSVPCVEG
jgi:heptosyltransferase-3